MDATPEGRLNDPAAHRSAGAWLKHARQQRGLHIAALAVMLKVPQAKLEAIEADRLGDLPDATFARALATAMCRALKIDAGPVLALMPALPGREFDMRPSLNQPFREHGGSGGGEALSVLARPVVWGPLLLLVAAAAIYWIPAGWLPASDAPAPVAVAASASPVEFVPAPMASAAASALPASAPASLPVALPPAAPVAVASAPAPAVVPAGTPSLRLSATAASWVEVSDARGQVLFSRVLQAGEEQQLNGSLPLKLRVGNVGATRVEWRGAAVDLAARGSNNVARLELN